MLKFIRLESATKVGELMSLAYQLKGGAAAAATATAASEALFLANPQLRDKKLIAKGTLVLVPDIGKAPAAKEAAPVEIPLANGALTDKQIASLAADTTAAAKAARESAADTAAALKQARKFIAEVAPGAELQLDKIVEQAKRVADAAQKSEKTMQKVFERMAEDMKRVRDL